MNRDEPRVPPPPAAATPPPARPLGSLPAKPPADALAAGAVALIAARRAGRDARRELAAIALAHGIAPQQLIASVAAAGRAAQAPPQPPAQSPAQIPVQPPAQPPAQPVLQSAAPTRPDLQQPSPAPATEADTPPETSPPAARWVLPAAVIITALVLTTSLAVLFSALGLFTPAPSLAGSAGLAGEPAPPAAPPEPQAAPPRAAPSLAAEGLFPAAPPTDAVIPADLDLARPITLVKELRAATDFSSVGSFEAASRVVAVIDVLAPGWPTLRPDERTAVHDAIVSFFYRAATSGPVADLLLAAVAQRAVPPPADVDADAAARSAWSLGMLARLRRERQLPAALLRNVDLRLAAAAGGEQPASDTFESGVLLALRRLGDTLAESSSPPAPAVWRRWTECLDAVSAAQPAARDATVIAALDASLRFGPSPESRPAARAALAELAAAVRWQSGATSKAWLLRALTNPDAPPSGLAAVTESIALRAGLPGIDPSMVLSANASEFDRRELRRRYSEAWNLADTDASNRFTTQLAQTLAAIEQAHAASPRPADIDHLAAAVRAARVSAAAAIAWEGDVPSAELALDDEAAPVAAVITSAHKAAGAARAADAEPWPLGGAWMLRLAQLGKSPQDRLAIIQSFDTPSPVGIADAGALVDQALRGTPATIRDAAGARVALLAADPAVVSSLLEQIGRAPRVERVTRLVADVTDHTVDDFPDEADPAWRTAVRRALVARLLQLLSADHAAAPIDELALLLADAYARRISPAETPIPPSEDPGAAAPNLDALARQLRDRWKRQLPASAALRPRLTVRDIEARASARARLAEGPIQRFVVEQLALAEFAAAVVAAEQPSAGDRVAEILTDLQSAHRAGDGVLAQAAAAELAVARLWAVRFDAPSPAAERSSADTPAEATRP